MQIKIICVGKLKESYLREAFAEYEKRLRPYAPLTIIECNDVACPEQASEKERQKVLAEEGAQILRHIHDKDQLIALTIPGRSYDSVDFAKALETWLCGTQRSLVFVIGGSLGLSSEVLARADREISLSKMTFPHQLARILLAEQLYRGFRILRGEPYHK